MVLVTLTTHLSDMIFFIVGLAVINLYGFEVSIYTRYENV